jgi:hypothetical protein
MTEKQVEVDYRNIAASMTARGYPLNHSSVRNYVLRGMNKITDRLIREDILPIKQSKCETVARCAAFQDCIGELLYASSFRRS